jgi:hypothetical protein
MLWKSHWKHGLSHSILALTSYVKHEIPFLCNAFSPCWTPCWILNSYCTYFCEKCWKMKFLMFLGSVYWKNMSTPDSCPPPPYSAMNTDTSVSSPPFNPGEFSASWHPYICWVLNQHIYIAWWNFFTPIRQQQQAENESVSALCWTSVFYPSFCPATSL